MAPILIAEPTAPLRQMLEAVLRSHGYEVTTAESGSAAVRHLASSEWKCVLVGSPVPLDGGGPRTLLEHIEVEKPSAAARVIVMTTRVTNKTLLRRAARLKVYAVFSEPCDVNMLMSAIAACVEGRKPDRRWVGFPEPYLDEIFAAAPEMRGW